MNPCRHLSVGIRRPPAEVCAFVADPANLTRWATGLSPSMRVRFAEPNRFGVLDHDVEVETGETFHNPMRVVPNGAGSEVVFTLFRRPGMSEEEFARDVAWVEKDLGILKGLLEGS